MSVTVCVVCTTSVSRLYGRRRYEGSHPQVNHSVRVGSPLRTGHGVCLSGTSDTGTIALHGCKLSISSPTTVTFFSNNERKDLFSSRGPVRPGVLLLRGLTSPPSWSARRKVTQRYRFRFYPPPSHILTVQTYRTRHRCPHQRSTDHGPGPTSPTPLWRKTSPSQFSSSTWDSTNHTFPREGSLGKR